MAIKERGVMKTQEQTGTIPYTVFSALAQAFPRPDGGFVGNTVELQNVHTAMSQYSTETEETGILNFVTQQTGLPLEKASACIEEVRRQIKCLAESVGLKVQKT